jgi:hypothetical protein
VDIETVLRTDYECGAVSAPWEAVTWAAETVKKSQGVDTAREQLRSVCILRERYGRYVGYYAL